MLRLSTGLTAIAICLGQLAIADPLAGSKQVFLLDGSGNRTLIGTVDFAPDEDTATYRIDLSAGPFSEHFLSMRPFRCLEGPDKHWCHVPYPYELRREVSADDLTDLEYDLLFLHKGATEYGIDMWNGIYYRLQITDDRLIGQLNEMDMGLLAVPPNAGDLRPISDSDLHESEASSHWLPELVIE